MGADAGVGVDVSEGVSVSVMRVFERVWVWVWLRLRLLLRLQLRLPLQLRLWVWLRPRLWLWLWVWRPPHPLTLAMQAVGFLTKSGLDRGVLKQIWDLSDVAGRGFLDPEEFYLALRLVAHAQAGRLVSLELAYQDRLAYRGYAIRASLWPLGCV